MSKRRIAIVGAGTAGAAAGVFLARQGDEVSLFEKVLNPGAVGAGILLQPTGMAVLDELGLGDVIRQLGSRVETLWGETYRGREVINLHYRQLADDCHGVGIHRASLFSVLHDALAEEGVAVVTGKAVACYEKNPQGVALFDDEGAALGQFDALVVANGTRSELRARHSGVLYDEQYPWGALWAIVEQPEGLPNDQLRQVYRGARYMAGVLPTGTLPGQGDKPLMSFFWSMPVAMRSAWESGEIDFQQWKEKVLGHWPELAPVMAQLHSREQLAFANYRDVVMKDWVDGPVVFIGDAAHAMSPQLGQGANLALMDASVLARVLGQQHDVELAFEQYNRLRRGHIRFYQNMSRLMTPFYQSHSRLWGWLRDMFSLPVSRIPWVHRQMLATLTGIKNGWFSQMKPAALPPSEQGDDIVDESVV